MVHAWQCGSLMRARRTCSRFANLPHACTRLEGARTCSRFANLPRDCKTLEVHALSASRQPERLSILGDVLKIDVCSWVSGCGALKLVGFRSPPNSTVVEAPDAPKATRWWTSTHQTFRAFGPARRLRRGVGPLGPLGPQGGEPKREGPGFAELNSAGGYSVHKLK